MKELSKEEKIEVLKYIIARISNGAHHFICNSFDMRVERSMYTTLRLKSVLFPELMNTILDYLYDKEDKADVISKNKCIAFEHSEKSLKIVKQCGFTFKEFRLILLNKLLVELYKS